MRFGASLYFAQDDSAFVAVMDLARWGGAAGVVVLR
jgi:hypothetical protein